MFFPSPSKCHAWNQVDAFFPLLRSTVLMQLVSLGSHALERVSWWALKNSCKGRKFEWNWKQYVDQTHFLVGGQYHLHWTTYCGVRHSYRYGLASRFSEITNRELFRLTMSSSLPLAEATVVDQNHGAWQSAASSATVIIVLADAMHNCKEKGAWWKSRIATGRAKWPQCDGLKSFSLSLFPVVNSKLNYGFYSYIHIKQTQYAPFQALFDEAYWLFQLPFLVGWFFC